MGNRRLRRRLALQAGVLLSAVVLSGDMAQLLTLLIRQFEAGKLRFKPPARVAAIRIAALMRSLSSCSEVTRMWRRTERGELGKKALNEVELGVVFRWDGEFEAAGGLIREPSSGLLGDVGGMIVENQLDRRMAG